MRQCVSQLQYVTADPPERHRRSGTPHRWWILATAGVAQLMVILDASIVNIALPSAQRTLGFADADRQWVVTAYGLAFGSLLLIGGRLADLLGRNRTFVAGLVGFAAASAVAGAAGNFATLVAGRAAQGVFGALLAPAALSIVAVTFDDSRHRARAFGSSVPSPGPAARSACWPVGC
jgi:MFS family permease